MVTTWQVFDRLEDIITRCPEIERFLNLRVVLLNVPRERNGELVHESVELDFGQLLAASFPPSRGIEFTRQAVLSLPGILGLTTDPEESKVGYPILIVWIWKNIYNLEHCVVLDYTPFGVFHRELSQHVRDAVAANYQAVLATVMKYSPGVLSWQMAHVTRLGFQMINGKAELTIWQSGEYQDAGQLRRVASGEASIWDCKVYSPGLMLEWETIDPGA